jgi:HAD superfamily hydrolase (TIGR01450 family)
MGVGQGARRDHLMELTFDRAFADYESVRARLPGARAVSQAPRQAATLDEIADQFDAFLLDAFGVLNIGETAIPGVADRVRALQSAGKRVLVVSNAAGVHHDALMAKYTRLGYDFAPDDVISSRKALQAGLARQAPRHWGQMVTRGNELEGLQALAEDPAAYDDVEGFVLVGTAEWTEARQALLEASLLRNPRPVLVGNPDLVAPREVGFSIEPGHFAHRLAERTGIVPEFFGKPLHNIYDLAFARLDPRPDPARILMVGDSLHTDILGAHTAGIASALVTGYGFFAGQDADAAIAATGIVPDILLAQP